MDAFLFDTWAPAFYSMAACSLLTYTFRFFFVSRLLSLYRWSSGQEPWAVTLPSF
mgnify:CR=1 FL=1